MGWGYSRLRMPREAIIQMRIGELELDHPKYKAGYSHFGVWDEQYHCWRPVCGGWTFGADAYTINDKEVKCKACLEKEPRANEILAEQEQEIKEQHTKKYQEQTKQFKKLLAEYDNK